MNKLAQTLKDTYGYSNYELALVKYTLESIFSEFSKIIILGIFYFFTGYFSSFVIFILSLALLRVHSGGFHCKHYFTCFLFTFIMSYFAIVLLPCKYSPSYLMIMVCTTICLFVNYYIGPISSPFRPTPDSLLLKHCKNKSFLIVFLYLIIVSIFKNYNLFFPFVVISFWTIILHTMQMIIAKILLIGGIVNEV